MYYQYLVVHLDAPYLLLSGVLTGLFIRIFYKSYINTRLSLRVFLSILLFLLNAVIIVPGIVFIYRWLMICGFYQPDDLFNFTSGCSPDVISLNLMPFKNNIIVNG